MPPDALRTFNRIQAEHDLRRAIDAKLEERKALRERLDRVDDEIVALKVAQDRVTQQIRMTGE